MKKTVCIVLAAAALVSCGGRAVKNTVQPARRAFPSVEIPAMLTDGGERLDYILRHFWDRFTDTTTLYLCDSLTVNGASLEDAESQMGLYATLLQHASPQLGKASVSAFFDRAETFGLRYPGSNVFQTLSEWSRKYFYDPNSPVRNEDFYGVYVARLAASPLTEDSLKPGYRYEAALCALNPVGSVATDFAFTDTAGKIRTLHGIKADWTLLIFGHPDCNACRELTQIMESSSAISERIASGELKVADIFIDPEIEEWKAGKANYPATWICGYDHTFQIRENRLYHVRGIPSLYLLDADKKILLKDAPQEIVLDMLEAL